MRLLKLVAIYFGICLFCLVSITGCRSHPKYPGFVTAGVEKGSRFYIDPTTIQHLPGSEALVFTQVTEAADRSYDIGEVAVNCTLDKTVALEGSHYRNDGTYDCATARHDQKAQSVVAMVCGKLSTIPEFSGDFKLNAAFQAGTGGNFPVWTPALPGTNQMGILADYSGKQFAAKVLLDQAFTEGGKEKNLLVLGSVPSSGDYDCHACGVLISAFVFRHEKVGWFIEAVEPYLTIAGQYATAPEVKFLQLGPARNGFTILASFMAQGYSTEGQEIFAPWGRRIDSLIQLETSSDNSGAVENGPIQASKMDLTLGPSATNGIYDLHLRTTGTKLSNTPSIVSADKVQLCKVIGTQYNCDPK